MTEGAGSGTALLIAAHGERRPEAANEGVTGIARAVRAHKIVSEVAAGFINGTPAIPDALGGLTARKVLVYPLFAANGYFTRDRLVQVLDEANGQGRAIHILQPLGLDPGLPKLVADRVTQVARGIGIAPAACSVILLAHGSRRNPASRKATEWVAAEITGLGVYRSVKVAFLEERPLPEEVATSCPGPAIVVGMFSGEGLHGARDAPRLIAMLGRADIAYAGVIGNSPGVDEIIVRAVQQAL